MGALDRFRRRQAAGRSVPEAVPSRPAEAVFDEREESRLWAVLREDPNDVESFHLLADIVRRRAAQGHEEKGGRDPQRAADDAAWALAEELAHSGRAWYPLIELARLSVRDDHEGALRRVATAAERDTTGCALATGLEMLREANMPAEALGLGVGHWRPREHDVEAGRQLVEAAIEAGRVGEARRHLEALALNPDEGRVASVRAELERLIAQTERSGRPPGERTPPPARPAPGTTVTGGTATTGPGTGGLPVIDRPVDVVDLRIRDLSEGERRDAEQRERERRDEEQGARKQGGRFGIFRRR